ncbi:MAG: drug/metabolite transporter (DMT)-like permease [Phenylobacterium sp.]|jgi:drug/metabolite transporter (DMT)-like permease
MFARKIGAYNNMQLFEYENNAVMVQKMSALWSYGGTIMVWVYMTIFATIMQTWRNSLQSGLSKTINVTGVTLARFLWAGPVAALYLLSLYLWQPQPLPVMTNSFILLILAASATQIFATGLLVVLFKQNNFAIGAGLAKSEAIIAAIIGVIFMGTQLPLLGWAGVLLGSVAVFYMSHRKGSGRLSLSTLLLGLACGSSFALTSLAIRAASLSLDLPFLHRAAWVLLLVISTQTLVLLAYLAIKDRDTLKALWQKPKLVIMTSVTSCFGSIGWFTAMSLQTVPYVKTLGQVEVFFTLLFSTYYLKVKVTRKDTVSLLLIAVAAILVMMS